MPSSVSVSSRLFRRALATLPGGVDSPVRAFKAVGGTPRFITRGRGAIIVDADGHRYIDCMMSWGPLIHGHAPAGLVAALDTRRAQGDELRRLFGAGGPPRRARQDADARHRTGAIRQLRHRGDDERGAGRAGGDAARPHHQVRGLLPRACGFVPGQGRVRGPHAGCADEPRGAVGAGGRHPRRRLQRPRHRWSGCCGATRARLPPSSSSPSPATWASYRRLTGFWRDCGSCAIAPVRCSSSMKS